MEHLQACPSCGETGLKPFLTCTDFTYSQDSFHIVECSSCGLRFTNPRPAQNEIGKYYQSDAYVSHNDTDSGLMFKAYQTVKRFTLKGKTRLVQSITKQGNALDYGAGTGDFANAISQGGFNTSVFEPDDSARTRIRTKYPLLNIASSLDDLTDASQQVITLWHVLEHVHNLRETLLKFHSKLDADGTLIIAVPNCDSLDAMYYGEHWAAYDVPRHLYHFSPKTIAALFERTGFRLLSTRPMWFDSFYVSLLSSQYKNPAQFALGRALNSTFALLIGTLSNLYTIIDKKRCSSIIYILKKQ